VDRRSGPRYGPQTERVHSLGDPGLRLAPHAVLLRRSATELQVGVEPCVVVPEAYDRLLRALAEGAGPERLRQTAYEQGLETRAVPDLLGALAAARLLRPTPVTTARAVRVVGAGRLGARTAHELVAAGFSTLYLADLPERSKPDQPRTRPGGPTARSSGPDRLDLLAATLADVRPGVRVRRARHFVHPEGDAVALTVVVADGPEPDRLVPDLLREAGAPHLLVRCSGDEAVVGPLVVPGTTSCVRCADLARRDADPRWPWLLEQLTRLRIEPAPTLLAWAAVTAAVQALAFVGGTGAETVGHTLELGTEQHTMRLRASAVHPECPCRWIEATASVGHDLA
jgi:bacteriocin biosynthesis cyclodehydratase domain-containing protein